MNYTFLDKQKIYAKENYNYFFMKMIFKVLYICFKITIILVIRQIFSNIISNIFSILYILSSIYNIYDNIIKYNLILNDIKKILKINNSYLEIDLSGNLFKKVVNYGK